MNTATQIPETEMESEIEVSKIVTKKPVPKLAYSPKEVAQALGISAPSAYELFRRADFPSIKIGQNRMLVPIAALEQWLMEQTKGDK